MASDSSKKTESVKTHLWQDGRRGWQICENCGQLRRRVDWGWIVRVYSGGHERQVMVRDGENETPCAPFVSVQ
jgi:hypothetical protein